jgi:hypothetical protein
MYTIFTKPCPAQTNSDFHQFARYVGEFKTIEDAEKGARYLSNSRRIPLERYIIVEMGDASRVVVANIQPGPAGYVYGAKMN